MSSIIEIPKAIFIIHIDILKQEGPLISIPRAGVYPTLELAKKALEELANKHVSDKIHRFRVYAQVLNPPLNDLELTDNVAIAGYLSDGKVYYWKQLEEPQMRCSAFCNGCVICKPERYTSPFYNWPKTKFSETLSPEEQKLLADAMWYKHTAGCLYTCAMCSKCGCSSTTTCACAEQRFKTTLTTAQLQEFKKEKQSQPKPPQFSFGTGFSSTNNNNSTLPKSSRYGCAFQGCQGCVECEPKTMAF